MRPILIRIGSLTIYSYGFMLAIAFFVGTLLARHEARRKGIEPDVIFDLVLLIALAGIVGARFFYVIGHWQEFLKKPLTALAIWQPGLVFYGGLLGGAIVVIIFVKVKKLALWDVADMITPSLALGYAIARIGCFLNGCCYGAPSNLPWAVNFFDVTRHPTQLYSFGYGLIIFAIVWFTRRKINTPGILFWFFLVLYSVARFTVEFFRVSERVIFGLSAAQLISILIFLVASAVIIANHYKQKGSNIDRMRQKEG
jgi:phosphatidylglycerol:prolipoprotein diacylglycerol transferase